MLECGHKALLKKIAIKTHKIYQNVCELLALTHFEQLTGFEELKCSDK